MAARGYQWRRHHRRKSPIARLLFCMLLGAGLTVTCLLGLWSIPDTPVAAAAFQDVTAPMGSSRVLLALTTRRSVTDARTDIVDTTDGILRNCTPQAISQFPRDFFTDRQRRQGWLILHVLVATYTFIGLAFLCDDYFVPCLESICEALHLAPDVGGATFMAAGSSAPELATAIIGVFIAKDDIALSSVVGSAVYNVTFVISMCGFFAPCVIYLNWYPLVRDSAFYAICVVLLAWIIGDSRVTWYESVIFLVFYAFYIAIMVVNPWLASYFSRKCSRCLPEEHEMPVVPKANGTHYDKLETGSSGSADHLEMIDTNSRTTFSESADILPAKYGQNGNNGSIDDGTSLDSADEEAPEESDWVLAWPEGCASQFLHIILFPLKLCTFVSVLDCRRPMFKRCFVITFICSCAWISALAYVMIWMITVAGHTLRIPDSVMGLSFIAAGASVPDAIASVIVVREGGGDMAVSNAIGSNVFDILVCMGIPWFLMTIISGKDIRVFSTGLIYSSLTLLSTVVILIAITHINRWRLDKRLGFVLLILYILFTCLSILFELNLFGYVHPPECPVVY